MVFQFYLLALIANPSEYCWMCRTMPFVYFKYHTTLVGYSLTEHMKKKMILSPFLPCCENEKDSYLNFYSLPLLSNFILRKVAWKLYAIIMQSFQRFLLYCFCRALLQFLSAHFIRRNMETSEEILLDSVSLRYDVISFHNSGSLTIWYSIWSLELASRCSLEVKWNAQLHGSVVFQPICSIYLDYFAKFWGSLLAPFPYYIDCSIIRYLRKAWFWHTLYVASAIHRRMCFLYVGKWYYLPQLM